MTLRSLAAPALGLLTLTACAPVAMNLAEITLPKTLYFHPVQGPIFNQHPETALAGSVTGAYRSGSMVLTLPSGEVCQGPWAIIPQSQVEATLAGEWDQIYGTGYFVRAVQGARQRGKATLTGDRGSVFQAEFSQGPEKDAPLRGVAKDKSGNLFKIVR